MVTITHNIFKKIRINKISCTTQNNNCIIKLNDLSSYKNCSCSCKYFIREAICTHVLAYSSLYKLDYYESKPETAGDESICFDRKKKRGPKVGGRSKKAEKALHKE